MSNKKRTHEEAVRTDETCTDETCTDEGVAAPAKVSKTFPKQEDEAACKEKKVAGVRERSICPICLEGFCRVTEERQQLPAKALCFDYKDPQGPVVYNKPCIASHTYHAVCIEKYGNGGFGCPICRQMFVNLFVGIPVRKGETEFKGMVLEGNSDKPQIKWRPYAQRIPRVGYGRYIPKEIREMLDTLFRNRFVCKQMLVKSQDRTTFRIVIHGHNDPKKTIADKEALLHALVKGTPFVYQRCGDSKFMVEIP